jgi:hypothetical protein
MFTRVTFQKIKKRFQTNKDHTDCLVAQKWGNCYVCPKCSHTSYSKGRQWFYRRCEKCAYDESATDGTLFHRCKLDSPIVLKWHLGSVSVKGAYQAVNWLRSLVVSRNLPG